MAIGSKSDSEANRQNWNLATAGMSTTDVTVGLVRRFFMSWYHLPDLGVDWATSGSNQSYTLFACTKEPRDITSSFISLSMEQQAGRRPLQPAETYQYVQKFKLPANTHFFCRPTRKLAAEVMTPTTEVNLMCIDKH